VLEFINHTGDSMKIKIVIAAYDFAKKAHEGQLRKGTLGLPYINHPVEVSNILVAAGYGAHYHLLAAALLHDVVEDCNVRPAQLGEVFGSDVVALVNELTFINLTKAEKIKRAPYLSAEAGLIKVADLTSNVGGLADDPSAMEQEDAYAYVRYALAMVEAIKPPTALRALFAAALLRFNLTYQPH
jgi:(p)ppGpp synthase/HD superfamily hydrolase